VLQVNIAQMNTASGSPARNTESRLRDRAACPEEHRALIKIGLRIAFDIPDIAMDKKLRSMGWMNRKAQEEGARTKRRDVSTAQGMHEDKCELRIFEQYRIQKWRCTMPVRTEASESVNCLFFFTCLRARSI
jgi:hypothetical protein